MYTLTREESRQVTKKAGSVDPLDLTGQTDPFCLSWAGLKVLDMTHVRVAYGSITTVDLSGNLLVSLPDSFSRCLRHVQYLDLSRNQLMSLPRNFGLMENLHTLILYMNKLESLPVSFRKMDKLRWLDLMGNPLEPRLLSICGEDLTFCEVVARNVVEFMRDLHNAKKSTEVRQAAAAATFTQVPDEAPNLVVDEDPALLLSSGRGSKTKLDKEFNYQKTAKNKSQDQLPLPPMIPSDNNNVKSDTTEYVGVTQRLAPIVMTALYSILVSLVLFVLMSFLLAMYNQGPPKGLLKGGKLQDFDQVPTWALNSFAWAVHICPGCVPYRATAVSTIVVPESSFFQSFVNIFFRPLFHLIPDLIAP